MKLARLLHDIIAKLIDCVMEQVLVQDLEALAFRRHYLLAHSISICHFVEDETLVEDCMLVAHYAVTQLFDNTILANHAFHL